MYYCRLLEKLVQIMQDRLLQFYRNVSSDWVGRLDNPTNISKLANTAWQTANSPSGKVATMIIPADYAWSDIDIDIEPKVSRYFYCSRALRTFGISSQIQLTLLHFYFGS